jgi:hypothetical protein
MLLGPITCLVLFSFAAGVSWLWLFGDNQWPETTQWVLPLIGAIGGLLVAASCIAVAYTYGKSREVLALATRGRERQKIAVLIITPLLIATLLSIKACKEKQAYTDAMAIATQREAAFAGLVAACHKVNDISITQDTDGVFHTVVRLTGKREGTYRLSWQVTDTRYSGLLASGSQVTWLQPGAREVGIAFTLIELARRYEAKVLKGHSGILVEQLFELTTALEPVLSEAERAALPPGERRRLEAGESPLRFTRALTFRCTSSSSRWNHRTIEIGFRMAKDTKAVAASPCRLSVYLSRKSKAGLILRRGPSDWSQLIHWDRNSDRFTPGQWLHGRVYERRCDLSPSGRYFVYFAAKHGRARDPEGVGEAWTAVSRPPYFTALCLWQNVGSWYGGGIFKTDKILQLDATCTLLPHAKFSAKHLKVVSLPLASSPWEQRLLRDGWQLIERGFDPRTFRRIGDRELWEKTRPQTSIKLCRQVEEIDFKRFGGPYAETFWIETGSELIPLEGVSWADWDTWERLVFVRGGRLFSATIEGADIRPLELFDFNPFKPRPLAPAGWAQGW